MNKVVYGFIAGCLVAGFAVNVVFMQIDHKMDHYAQYKRPYHNYLEKDFMRAFEDIYGGAIAGGGLFSYRLCGKIYKLLT